MKLLETVQELDSKIDSVKGNKAAIPAALKASEDACGKAKTAMDQRLAAITEYEKIQKQTRAAIDLNNDRLARATSKFEAVGNTTEYAAANRELEQLRKLNLTLEDQIKKAGLDIENAQKDVLKLQDALAAVEQTRDAEAAALSGENGKFDTDITALEIEKKKHSSKIEPRLYAQYNRVRLAKNGLGIVPAVGGRCKGCNMMIPPQMYNEIQRSTQLHQCPSCYRLLYVPTQTESASASA